MKVPFIISVILSLYAGSATCQALPGKAAASTRKEGMRREDRSQIAVTLSRIIAGAASPLETGTGYCDTLEDRNYFGGRFQCVLPFPGSSNNIISVRSMEPIGAKAKSFWSWLANVPYGVPGDSTAVYDFYEHLVDSITGSAAYSKQRFYFGKGLQSKWRNGDQSEIELSSIRDTGFAPSIQISVNSQKEMLYNPQVEVKGMYDYWSAKALAGLVNNTAVIYYLTLASQLTCAGIESENMYSLLAPLYVKLTDSDLRLAIPLTVIDDKMNRFNIFLVSRKLRNLISEPRRNELAAMAASSKADQEKLNLFLEGISGYTGKEREDALQPKVWKDERVIYASQSTSATPAAPQCYKYQTCQTCKGKGGWTHTYEYSYTGLYHDFYSTRTEYATCADCHGSGVVRVTVPCNF